jgi:hypothetical protein
LHERGRRDVLPVIEVHDADTGGVAALDRDVGHGDADDDAT